LWGAIRRFGARSFAIGTPAVIELTDGIRRHRLQSRARAPLALPTSAPSDITIAGPISELLLYTVGRAGANVTVFGDPGIQARLEARNRSI
jgi:hypothetical protein